MNPNQYIKQPNPYDYAQKYRMPSPSYQGTQGKPQYAGSQGRAARPVNPKIAYNPLPKDPGLNPKLPYLPPQIGMPKTQPYPLPPNPKIAYQPIKPNPNIGGWAVSPSFNGDGSVADVGYAPGSNMTNWQELNPGMVGQFNPNSPGKSLQNPYNYMNQVRKAQPYNNQQYSLYA